jgi:hypothetical protein
MMMAVVVVVIVMMIMIVVVMVMIVIFAVQEIRLDIDDAIKVEGLAVEHLVKRDL